MRNVVSMADAVERSQDRLAPMIEFKAAHVRFGSLDAMGPVDLSVKRGEFLAVITPAARRHCPLIVHLADEHVPYNRRAAYRVVRAPVLLSP